MVSKTVASYLNLSIGWDGTHEQPGPHEVKMCHHSKSNVITACAASPGVQNNAISSEHFCCLHFGIGL
ncbi:MAG: hypothetical protein IPQ18_04770 [Saprospiraceae bacterium]|nr:hypothetical protein [Saprospiraceae bacterium]